MAEELLPADVEAYTKGRLLASDPETVRGLAAALARIRRWCGWHVTPVQTQTFYIDRAYSSQLILPTLKIVEIESITVDGVVVDVSDVAFSRESPGLVQKTDLRPWSTTLSTSGLGQIEIEVSHGYTAAEAADFREVVLQFIDSVSLSIGTGGSGPVTRKKVDDVEYGWSGFVDRSWGIAKNPVNESVLYQYRLLPIS